MDAVKYLKEKNRMCRKCGELPGGCFECPIRNDSGGCQAGVFENQEVTEEMLVQIVERWAAEHPKKTRQSEFLKMFPNAMYSSDSSTLMIKPCELDQTELQNGRRCDDYSGKCQSCRKEYWSEEVK